MSITDYGAFVELEPGVEGLIHVSEMSWTKKVKHPSKLLEVGQEVECQVLEVDADAKRISLGLKQLEPDPWTLFTDKYNPGDKIARQGPLAHRLRRVRRHRRGRRRHGPQDATCRWTQRKVNNPADLYHKGDDVEAIILSINHDEKKVSPRHQAALRRSVDSHLPDNYPVGTVLEVRVKSIADFGVFVEIERGVEGLVHVSRATRRAGTATPSQLVKEGDIVKAEIISMDPDERRIALSFKRAFEREETAEALKFMERATREGRPRASVRAAAPARPWATCSSRSSATRSTTWPRSSGRAYGASTACSSCRVAVGAAHRAMRYRVARGGVRS